MAPSTHCVGLDGPCPSRTKLRRDSVGALCHRCRERLVWNGLVDAAPVRKHLRALSRKGVGHESVAAACDVSVTVLADVLARRKTRVRKQTADRVLAVTADAIADHGIVPAGPTQRRLRQLEEEYFSKAGVARALGYQTPALQIGRKRVLAKTAQRVARLHRKAMGEA